MSLVYRHTSPASLPHDSVVSTLRPATTLSESASGPAQGDLSLEPVETENLNENEDTEPAREDLLRDLPEWLRDFTENLVDERVQAHWDAPASSSRESASEPLRKVVLITHSVYTHFPKDINCDICKMTKITRAPCRKRTGPAVPRAENFGDLITADHNVLSKGCESRNNHRYAIVVQDLATQWIQSYPCKQKLHRKQKRAYKSSWSQRGNLKSFILTIPKNLAEPVKVYPGIIVRQHLTVQRQVALLKGRYANFC